MKTNKVFLSAIVLSVAFTSVFVACSSDDDSEPLPPIGGFNSADEVGATDLVAYWPLNGTSKESKSGAEATASPNVTYVAGVKGEAANLNVGFLKYASMPGLSSGLESFSMSAWVKVVNNGASGSVFVSLTRPNEWAGNINFLAETGWMPATSDSITVKGYLVSNNGLAGQDTRNAVKVSPEDAALGHIANPNKIAGQWAHAVLTWDGATRLFKVYVNGVKISNPAWELRGAADSPAFAMTTPTFPVLGAYGTTAAGTSNEPWDKAMTGQLDEVRIWKKALIQQDVNALYQLELAGR